MAENETPVVLENEIALPAHENPPTIDSPQIPTHDAGGVGLTDSTPGNGHEKAIPDPENDHTEWGGLSEPPPDDPDSPVAKIRLTKKRKAVSVAKPYRKRGVILKAETIEEMFKTYCGNPNYAFVARTCGVRLDVVRKYANWGQWEERRLAIIKEAQQQSDYTLVKATANSIIMLRALKNKIAQKINALDANRLNTDTIVADFERLAKLEQLLLGGVNARDEHVITSHEERIKRLREERNAADSNAHPPIHVLPSKVN